MTHCQQSETRGEVERGLRASLSLNQRLPSSRSADSRSTPSEIGLFRPLLMILKIRLP